MKKVTVTEEQMKALGAIATLRIDKKEALDGAVQNNKLDLDILFGNVGAIIVSEMCNMLFVEEKSTDTIEDLFLTLQRFFDE